MSMNNHSSAGALLPERPARRLSAVSRALRALCECAEEEPPAWHFNAAEERHEYRISVASDLDSRERAYRLAQQVYRRCGYASSDAAWCVSPFDAHPETLTLLVEDGLGREAATISLVTDSHAGLPCDEVFGRELHALRAQGRRLAEVTRLVIAEEHARARTLLIRLFNFVYIYARHVRHADDFVIEVNPRHATYYTRWLAFERAASGRLCPRVQWAPAVLLRMDLARAEGEVQRVGGQGAAAGERTMFPYCYAGQDEAAVARFLARHQRPMSQEEQAHFGLAPAAERSVQLGGMERGV